MMNLQISPKDQELLSAFIDNELSSKQRRRLQARLERDPELNQALGEIQKTRKLLRSLPYLRAPRNFTLKPEMVGQPHVDRMKLFNTFRLLSAAASFLLILVLASDFFGFQGKFAKPEPVQQIVAIHDIEEKEIHALEAPAMQTDLEITNEIEELPAEGRLVDPEENVEAEDEPVEAESIEPDSYEVREAESMAADVASAEEPMPEEDDVGSSVGEVAGPEGDAVSESEETPLMLEAPPIEAGPSEGLVEDQEVTPSAKVVEEAELETQTKEVGQIEDGDLFQSEEDSIQTSGVDSGETSIHQRWSVLRVVETLLGLIALIGGVLAVYFWKISRNVA